MGVSGRVLESGSTPSPLNNGDLWFLKNKMALNKLSACASPPQYNDMSQWLQVELPQVKKITGIITQGAKSVGTEMYVMSYTLQYSDNGIHWDPYTDDEELQYKVQQDHMGSGNTGSRSRF